MNVIELFTHEDGNDLDIRITCGYRWMIMDDRTHEFIVYERRPYQKNTYMIGQTDDEYLAYNFLISDM